MRRQCKRSARAGFSLVELLVAFALIVFIMAVIAQTFATASRVVSGLKVADEMEANARGVMIMLRDDLRANHFNENGPGSQRKLSDTGFWDAHLGDPAGVPLVPTGFFRIYQVGRPTAVTAGVEIPSSVMTGASLHFTVYRQADTPGNMFSSVVPAGHALLTAGTPGKVDIERESRFQSISAANTQFRSPWGEVTWWLTPTGTTTVTPDATPGQPLYVLRRRQRALWPLPLVTVAGVPDGTPEVSGPPTGANSANLNDTVRVAAPPFRFGMKAMAAAEANGPGVTALADTRYAGEPTNTTQPYPQTTVEDIVIGDVLSFDVKVRLEGGAEFVDLGDASVQAYSGNNSAFPAATGPWCFDTWTNQTVGTFSYSTWSVGGTYASIPLYRNAGGQKIRIRAIQVTLRIWSQKDNGEGGKLAGTARQMTIVQEM